MGDSEHNGSVSELTVHLREANPERDRTNDGDCGCGGGICRVDDSAAVRVRDELSDPEVLASAEQDHGDGVDIGGGACPAHGVQLVADAEGGVGPGGCGGGAELVVVVHRVGAAGVYLQWDMWTSLDGLLLQSVSESLWIRSPLSCLRCHALVSLLFPALIIFIYNVITEIGSCAYGPKE